MGSGIPIHGVRDTSLPHYMEYFITTLHGVRDTSLPVVYTRSPPAPQEKKGGATSDLLMLVLGWGLWCMKILVQVVLLPYDAATAHLMNLSLSTWAVCKSSDRRWIIKLPDSSMKLMNFSLGQIALFKDDESLKVPRNGCPFFKTIGKVSISCKHADSANFSWWVWHRISYHVHRLCQS